MRRTLLLVLALLGLAGAARAQETYSIPATAGQATTLAAIVAARNGKTCERLGLAIGCTQAQACTAAGAAGGASCTAAQARTANARIWPATQGGREEFVQHGWVAPAFQQAKAELAERGMERLRLRWAGLTRAQKDADCQAIGQEENCELFQ